MKIDEYLPDYDERTSHRVLVQASPEDVWRALHAADFSDSFLVRVLMSVRSGRVLERQPPRPLRDRLAGTGFLELAELHAQEIVIGIAGRFWRPDGGRCLDLTPAAFRGFSRTGYAKAAWNFAVTPKPSGCLLSTETRVKCYGKTARLKFRAYWTVVKPFSSLIRRAILRHVKRAAESARAARSTV